MLKLYRERFTEKFLKNMSNEIWKDIKGFEGLYQVSNLGRVKSLERIDARGHRLKEKILKPRANHKGYYQVGLCKNSKVRFYFVHRLVWLVFNGQIPENMQVNHINEIKTDNRPVNLNLMTPKENTNWGTRNKRSTKKRSKVVLQFTLDGILVKEYPSTKQVERETGFANQYISACCNGKYKAAYGYKWKYKE